MKERMVVVTVDLVRMTMEKADSFWSLRRTVKTVGASFSECSSSREFNGGTLIQRKEGLNHDRALGRDEDRNLPSNWDPSNGEDQRLE